MNFSVIFDNGRFIIHISYLEKKMRKKYTKIEDRSNERRKWCVNWGEMKEKRSEILNNTAFSVLEAANMGRDFKESCIV